MELAYLGRFVRLFCVKRWKRYMRWKRRKEEPKPKLKWIKHHVSCGGAIFLRGFFVVVFFLLSQKSFIWPFHFHAVFSSHWDGFPSLCFFRFHFKSQIATEKKRNINETKSTTCKNENEFTLSRLHRGTSVDMILFGVAQFIFCYRRKRLIFF